MNLIRSADRYILIFECVRRVANDVYFGTSMIFVELVQDLR